ncbi:hypothetical protein BJ165DRAFT_181135 [Panaeolus papilionaceus]|nr:hypothetical protein BJ165DRAFT_181135 [Panaeolus papilionaceus]
MASSSLQSPTFPLEIFHLIVRNLAYSEPNDNRIVLNIEVLRQCSLVCRAWVPICQAYLFKSGKVDLERMSDSGPEKGIIRAIAAHPHIASHVQKICYTAKGGVQLGHIPDPNIFTLLTLPNLRSIYVCRGIGSPHKFDQLYAGDFIFFRLWADCISSSLTLVTDLTLHRVADVPLVSLLSCPNLKSLSLMACICIDRQTQPASAMVQMTSKIESLKLMSTTKVSYAFLGTIPHLKQLSVYEVEWCPQPQFKDQLISTFRGLKKLTVDYHWVQDPQLWVSLPLSIASGMGVKLFENLKDFTAMLESEQEAAEIYQALQHAPSINYLDVSFSKSPLIPYLNIHQFLPQNVGSLKTLHIRLVNEYFGEQCDDGIEAISQALSLVESPASLEKLVITLKIEPTELLALFGMLRQLKTLDTALFVDSSMFPLLRWITFGICVQNLQDDAYYSPRVDNKMQADMYEYIEAFFPAFRRSSNSRINFKLWLETANPDD